MQIPKDILAELGSSEFHTNLTQHNCVRFDNSEFTNWNDCLVKGLFAGALKRQLASGQTSLVFGGAVHEALEMQLRGHDLQTQLDAAFQYADEHNLAEISDERRNPSSLRELIYAYNNDVELRPQHQQFRPIEVEQHGERKPFVEESFSLRLGAVQVQKPDNASINVEIWWEGKIDCIAFYDTAVAVVDHKTTSVMGAKFADDKMRSNQMLGYMWAATQLLKAFGYSKPPKEVVINAIALRKNNFDFEHFRLPYAAWQLEEWQSQVLLNVRNICTAYLEAMHYGFATPNRESCVGKYGRCAFFDVCQAHSNMRSRMLNSSGQYIKSTWSPHNK